MTFYSSYFSNDTGLNRGQPRPARHIACPQRLKYIHDIKDGYIPYVEDSSCIDRASYKKGLQNRLSLYNTMSAWRQELMGLAQQVQSSLIPVDEPRHSRSSRIHSPKRSCSSMSTYLEETDEKNMSKRLLNRRASALYQRARITKSKTPTDKNEQESPKINENQDSGIWLLPMLCHILQIDNIVEAQDWLVNANPTEKRLAMELISRTMFDMQNHENEFQSDISTCDQSSTSNNLNNIYWPYKVWQRQQQLKLTSPPLITIDNNDTCERATSPLRMLTPAKRSSTRNSNDRAASSLVSDRSNQNLRIESTKIIAEARRPSSRMSTPITPNSNDRPSRRCYRVTTSRSTSTTNECRPMPTALRGKTPLI